MCGITGFFTPEKVTLGSSVLLEDMLTQIGHRGPDSKRTFYNDNIGFGFARLSFVDLLNGLQPIFNEKEDIVLVCNGEIYNYRELRNELIKKGHKFNTDTDIEIIIHLYEEYDTEFLNRINGQFAFVIYDKYKNLVFGARDYAGICPFYYTFLDDVFVFSSEIKSLFKFPGVKREIDVIALDQLFTISSVVSPRTMFKNVKSLEAGHYLVYDRNGLRDREYKDLIYPYKNDIQDAGNIKDYEEELSALLKESVERRLNCDTEIGCYLSGGLDSSLIAALASNSNVLKGPLKTFAIGFDDSKLDESRYRNSFLNKFKNITHEEIRFNENDIIENLKRVIWHSETPIRESYNTASLLLSQKVKQSGLKGILTGEGADELFFGYEGYRIDILRNEGIIPTTIDPEESALRKKAWGNDKVFFELLTLREKEKKSIYSDALLDDFEHINCLNHHLVDKSKIENRHFLHIRSYLDYKLRLCDHLVSDHGDRMALANSVEARYPFLDLNVIDFVRRTPPEMMITTSHEKFLLKRLGIKILPHDIVKREKFAFKSQCSPSIIRKEIDWIEDILSHKRIKEQGIFNPNSIDNLKAKYKEKDFSINYPFESDLLLIIITLGIFQDLFIKSTFDTFK